MRSNNNNINGVFYAESYHPIQAGSIDGTDILPHDNAVYRALLCSSAGLYDPLADPKSVGDPYCTVFVGRLSHLTTEHILQKAMSKYGRIKSLRIVRDIVTGDSRGYAFVEYETEREMRCAFEDAHHTYIDDKEIIVDYNRQQLMPGWIPRRLGGGLGGRKESGQLRFGGRERPFRAPLKPLAIPFDELKKLGIPPPPPEGRYWPRNQVPSPPRRNGISVDREGSSNNRKSKDCEEYTRGVGSAKRGVEYDERDFTDADQQSDNPNRERQPRRRTADRSSDKHKKAYGMEEDSLQRQSSIEREDRYERRSFSHRVHQENFEEKDDVCGGRDSKNRHERSRSRSDRRSSRYDRERSHKRAYDLEEDSLQRISSIEREDRYERHSTSHRVHQENFEEKDDGCDEKDSTNRHEQSQSQSRSDRRSSRHDRERSHKRAYDLEEDSLQRQSSIEREDRYERHSSSHRVHQENFEEKDDGPDEKDSRNRHERSQSQSDRRSSRHDHERTHKRSFRHNKDDYFRKRHKDGGSGRSHIEERHHYSPT